MTEPKPYPLADILSVTTGRLLSRRHMDGLYDLLGYMTGESLFTHQLPRACDSCAPALLAQHPQLRDVAPPEDVDVPGLLAWLAGVEGQYGYHLPVSPLPAGTWTHQDPIEELCDRVGPEKVYVVPLPPEAQR